jgi:MoxR-like ATPase
MAWVKNIAWNIASPWIPSFVHEALESTDGVKIVSPTRSRTFKIDLNVVKVVGSCDGFKNLSEESGIRMVGRRLGVDLCMTATTSKRLELLTTTVFLSTGSTRKVLCPYAVGSAMKAAFESILDFDRLTCVEVTPVLVRADVFRRQVEFVQVHWKQLQFAANYEQHSAWSVNFILRNEMVVPTWVPCPTSPPTEECPVNVLGFESIKSQLLTVKTEVKVEVKTEVKTEVKVETRVEPAAVKRMRDSKDDTKKSAAWISTWESVPFSKFSKPPSSIKEVEEALDSIVHGMDEAKSVIFGIASQIMRKSDSPIRAIGLCGPPGCGKTSLANGIASALKRPSVIVGLGGAKDKVDLLGHDYTYNGSRPGRILRALVTAGVMDPVIVFDELDKVAKNEVLHVLMRLTDGTQKFEDDYLADVPLDLSRAIIVFTMNSTANIDPVLLDRLIVCEVKPLSSIEKKTVIEKKLAKDRVLLGETAWDDVTRVIESERGGMRGIEKIIERAVMLAGVRRAREGFSSNVDIVIEGIDVSTAEKALRKGEDDSREAYSSMYS